jgi:hypothetical protein
VTESATADPAAAETPGDQSAAGRDWAKYAVIAIGLALMTTLAVVVLIPRPVPQISYRVVSLDLTDQQFVHVTFEVEKAPLAEAKCDLAFFDGDGRADGRLTGIVIPPRRDNQRLTRMTQDFRPLEPVARAAISQCVITRTR